MCHVGEIHVACQGANVLKILIDVYVYMGPCTYRAGAGHWPCTLHHTASRSPSPVDYG